METEFNPSVRDATILNIPSLGSSTGAHSDLVYYIFICLYHNVSYDDYRNIEKGSLVWQLIKNTTSFYANFAKYR